MVPCKQSLDDNSEVGCLLYEYKDLASGTAFEFATRKSPRNPTRVDYREFDNHGFKNY